jgi:hypothetical protein
LIVTATDEVLDLLGYTMSDLVGHSIHNFNFQLSAQLSTPIPECTIKHANGNRIGFQVCIHQDPLGESSCLDYWLIRPKQEAENDDKSSAMILSTSTMLSIIRLSPYGTIEQVQPSPYFKQSISELIGRPVMAFVYHDDVEPLCSSLSKICSIHKRKQQQQQQQQQSSPLFIRWSRLPCLFEHKDDQESLNYDWISCTLMANSPQQQQQVIRPICVIRPLQVQQQEETEHTTLIVHVSLFEQLIKYCKCIYGQMMQVVEESAHSSKIYMNEFYQHVVASLTEMVATIMYFHHQGNNDEKTTGGIIWELIKSNTILQTSLNILQLTGVLNQSCMETT